jgi:hypothetical protein
MSAQSWLSTPPAPGVICTSASRWSYSPDSSVRTSRLLISRCRVGELGVGLRLRAGVVLLGGHLEQHAQVVEPPPQRLDAGDVALHGRQAGGDLLRLGGVVPQVRLAGLRLEVRQLDAQAWHVEHLLDAGQGAVEGGEIGTAVGGHGRSG